MDAKSEKNNHKKKCPLLEGGRGWGSIISSREDGPKIQNLVTIRVGFM